MLTNDRPKLISIEGATSYTGLGRTMLYHLLGQGEFAAVKAGNRTLITMDSLDAYIARLPRAEIRYARRSTAA